MRSASQLREVLARAIVRASTAPVRRGSVFGRGVAAARFTSDDGTTIHADVRAPAGAARGTVILAHGWRDGRGQLAFLAPPLLARGFRVVAIDFRGHGRSGGEQVTIGAREADDARAAIAAARESSDAVGYLGYSMGAAAYLLSRTEADAAVLDSPYDSLDGAVSARARRLRLSSHFTGVLAREASRAIGAPIDGVRPIDAVSALRRPTLFVFARHDPWIDAGVRQAFASRLPAEGALRVVVGLHHGHFGREWRREVVGFFDARMPGGRTGQS